MRRGLARSTVAHRQFRVGVGDSTVVPLLFERMGAQFHPCCRGDSPVETSPFLHPSGSDGVTLPESSENRGGDLAEAALRKGDALAFVLFPAHSSTDSSLEPTRRARGRDLCRNRRRRRDGNRESAARISRPAGCRWIGLWKLWSALDSRRPHHDERRLDGLEWADGSRRVLGSRARPFLEEPAPRSSR